jgi:hypothetical protein
MHYTVQARIIPETAADFLRKLTDGTIENQKPDGKEIVASMKRAVIDEDGIVRWSEVCYCPTPLQHERATVYDSFFDNIQTEEVENYVESDGEPFMAYLAQLA